MMKSLTAAVLALTALAGAVPAIAQVDQRHHDQQHRIAQGVRSGQLTRREARGLEHRQGRIDRTEARMRYRDGGHLTGEQRARLAHRENRASRAIFRDKHNGQVRG